MKYAVISYIYEEWKGQYEITEWADDVKAEPYEETPEHDRYIDLFDSYEEARAFYDKCVKEEG